ncbi:MAG: trimethylamine methyltransferase family protein [Armatimonadetes bacterium]|nr:trimethylamine methyltransferase family protein [Armatimonadota bacterium]
MTLRTRRPAILSQVDQRRILEAAVRVVKRVPLRCQGTPEFLDHLTAAGYQVDGELITFPGHLVDELVDRMAAHKAAANAHPPAELPSRLEYSTSGQGLYCCDLETDLLRLATVQDLADLSRVVEAIPGLGRAHPTFIPQDVPKANGDLHAFATIILNSSRPYRVSVYSPQQVERFFEVEVIARGGDREAVRRRPTFACKLWFNSPFMITRDNVEVAMKARALFGQPLEISIMPVAGSSTPVTMAGCLVHQTAESMVCNLLTLAVDNRLSGYRCGALATDMRSGVFTQSGPDVDLLQLASAEMSEYCFGGQVTVSRGPTTTAKVPGAQSMMEKSLATLLAVLSGTRSFGSLAVLAVADVGSLVQLMLDIELMEYLQRLLDGLAVDEERLAEEVIATVSPTGARFMEHEHTLRHFRAELFSPQLADRRVAGAWIGDPLEMVERARSRARELVRTAPNRCPLSEADRRAIAQIVAEADREALLERTSVAGG